MSQNNLGFFPYNYRLACFYQRDIYFDNPIKLIVDFLNGNIFMDYLTLQISNNQLSHLQCQQQYSTDFQTNKYILNISLKQIQTSIISVYQIYFRTASKL
ncbi:hypothetical protein pb186bvf_006233 [Paramecium bursaria]